MVSVIRMMQIQWKRIVVSVLVLVCLMTVGLFIPVRAEFFEIFNYTHTPTLDQGVKRRIEYDFPATKTHVVMPRFLAKPRIFQTGGGDQLVMLRTPADTCGLYQLSETIAPYDVGPPPHFHYASSEWFLVTEDSSFRIYGTQEYKPLQTGQLPGVNAPVPAMGSIVLDKGELAYSPKGTVHFWHNQSDTKKVIRGFYNVWAPANGVTEWLDGVNNLNGSTKPLKLPAAQETTLQTALWGVPHDPTGGFVGRSDFRTIRGPVASDGNHLLELQDLFDRGEACYPTFAPPAS